MKTRLFILLLFVALFMISGCKSYYMNKYCKPENNRRESNITVEKHTDSTFNKDSSVVVPATKGFIYLPSPCDSLGHLRSGVYTNNQGNNKTSLIINDTGIIVECYCEETVKYWRYQYQKTKDSLSILQNVSQTTVIEQQLNWFQHFRLNTGFFWWIGFILLLALVIYCAYKIFFLFR